MSQGLERQPASPRATHIWLVLCAESLKELFIIPDDGFVCLRAGQLVVFTVLESAERCDADLAHDATFAPRSIESEIQRTGRLIQRVFFVGCLYNILGRWLQGQKDIALGLSELH